MPESCATCRLCLDLVQYDYLQGGCKHYRKPGFICLAFASEGQACWMMGLDKQRQKCEMYEPREVKHD